MEYTFEKLNKDNFNKYYDYLSLASKLEPELMCSSDINKEELLEEGFFESDLSEMKDWMNVLKYLKQNKLDLLAFQIFF